VLWLIALAIAKPIANFNGMPILAQILPIIALGAVFQGLNSMAIFTANRTLNVKRVVITELASQCTIIVCIICFALYKPTIWAFVYGQLIGSALKTFLTHVIIPGMRHRNFKVDTSYIPEIWNFAKWIMLATGLFYLAGQSDKIFLPAIFKSYEGTQTLSTDALDTIGLYGIAAMWALVPLTLIYKISGTLYYPLISAALRGEASLQKVLSYRRALLITTLPIIAGLSSVAPYIFNLLYSPEYHRAGPIAMVMFLGTWALVVQTLYSAVNLASGKTYFISLAGAVTVLAFLSYLLPSYLMAVKPKIIYYAMIVAVLQSFAYIPLWIGARTVKASSCRSDMVISCAFFALAGVLIVISRQVYKIIPGDWSFTILSAQITNVMVASGMTMAIMGALIALITGITFFKFTRKDLYSHV